MPHARQAQSRMLAHRPRGSQDESGHGAGGLGAYIDVSDEYITEPEKALRRDSYEVCIHVQW